MSHRDVSMLSVPPVFHVRDIAVEDTAEKARLTHQKRAFSLRVSALQPSAQHYTQLPLPHHSTCGTPHEGRALPFMWHPAASSRPANARLSHLWHPGSWQRPPRSAAPGSCWSWWQPSPWQWCSPQPARQPSSQSHNMYAEGQRLRLAACTCTLRQPANSSQ